MDNGHGCLLVAIFAIFATLALVEWSVTYESKHYETIVVKEKTIGIGGNNSYLIYTEKDVYEVQDLLLIGFFNSSDVYNQIEVGDTIRVKVYGQRVPFLSAYKNIVEVQKQ